MDDTADTAQVIIHPPVAWGLAVIAGLALNWLVPLPFLPANLPVGWLGAVVFVLALSVSEENFHFAVPVGFGDELTMYSSLDRRGRSAAVKDGNGQATVNDRCEFFGWGIGARTSATKRQPQSQVGIAYFLAIRLSARVIDFACLLGRGMADPVDATR